jgi:hypothetical protein
VALSQIDLTTYSAALKELYDGQKVINLVYKKNPLLAMVTKDTKSGGKYIPVPVQYGVTQGRSATFATAQTNQTGAALAEFLLTRKSDYSLATLDNHTLEATANDAEAFVAAATTQVDSAFRSLVLSAASALYRAGSGIIGQITSITTGAIVLADASTGNQFEVGMTLQASPNSDASSPRAAAGYVIAVARSAATGATSVTVSASYNGAAGSPALWVANDYLLVAGDGGAKMSGLAGWCPTTAPSGGDNWYGVNRSVDSRLYGVIYDGSAQSIEEALIDASNYCAEQGGSPNKFFTNYRSYSALVKSLGSKVQYVDLESDVGIGFRGIRVHGDDGEIDVIPDRNCPGQIGYLLDLDSWKLRSVNEVPHIVTYGREGLEMLRVSNADAVELRVAYYANLACNAPVFNSVIKLPN